MDRDRDQQQLTTSFGAAAPTTGSHFVSSTASSLQSSTGSSPNDGMPSREKCPAVTLLYSYSNGNNVLFLEAGKDFVDILLSFLTRPLGSVIGLLSSNGCGGDESTGLVEQDEAIFKLFNSVKKMHEEKFCTTKKSFLDPDDAESGFGSKLLPRADTDQQHGTETSTSGNGRDPCHFYSCGMVPHCVCLTKKLGRRCPRHGRKMQSPCKFVEGKGEGESGSGKAMETVGYVKNICRYFITDNLEVYPGSKSLTLLHKLKVERMSMLNSLDLFVGMDEILKLLKASLVSHNVLQDVFGQIVEERYITYKLTTLSKFGYGCRENVEN